MYTTKVRKYAEWLGHNPDAIIQDVKPVGAIPDPVQVQSHCEFLSDYLAALQDSDLKPGAVSNYIKAVKTFYRTNGIKKVELDEPLSRKVTHKDRAPKPEEIALCLDKAATREAFIVAAIASGAFREGTFAKLKYRHVKEDWGQNPEEILSKDALLRGNITETHDQTQNHQLSILAEQLKQIIRKEATE